MAAIYNRINEKLLQFGFETYPFKVGWYNDHVGEHFILPYDYDTLAILVVSTPDMFDKSLIPYILKSECPGTGDLLDQCIAQHFKDIKMELKDHDIEAIHDFEMLPSRRPKILVQTAGHVSGAAFYYQRKDVQPDPWTPETKIFGVSIHAKYGGWFALRGVLIFKDTLCPDLPARSPVDIVASREARIELLEKFNFSWQDWTYRDIIPVEKKYSELQKQYFATLPKDRFSLIQKIKSDFFCCET